MTYNSPLLVAGGGCVGGGGGEERLYLVADADMLISEGG